MDNCEMHVIGNSILLLVIVLLEVLDWDNDVLIQLKT